MIKGKLRQEFLTVEEILDKTNGGYDIYMRYLGKVSRIMSRPWGKKESKDSWGVFPGKNVWLWKDQATEESGNAIKFVEKHFNITHIEAKDKICWDFGFLGDNKNPVQVIWQAPEESKEYMDINFTDKPFTSKHHQFWNAAEVTEEQCKKYKCYAVKDLAIARKKVPIKKDEIVFIYQADDDTVKVYFPEREKGDRFRTNTSYHYLWNYSNLKECNNLIVQKSFKDMLVTTLVNECCIATQAEAVKIFDEDTVKLINKISKKPWIWYGSDWDGVKKCKEITDTNGWKYINTPKDLLPEINDTYGYVKKFGLKKLEEFMISKKLI